MKKQDIRDAYTAKLTELLNQGYTIFPDTMSGHQGEIAHIDLRKGPEILRLLLSREYHWVGDDSIFLGDCITLTVGRAAPDTWVSDHWDGTVWNSRLEPIFEIKWAEISERGNGWYTTIEEGVRIHRIRRERYSAQHNTWENLGDAYKPVALRWLRKQPKMKSCKKEDIEKVQRVTTPEGQRHYEIRAKGHNFTIG